MKTFTMVVDRFKRVTLEVEGETMEDAVISYYTGGAKESKESRRCASAAQVVAVYDNDNDKDVTQEWEAVAS
jgi:hypothetical protein